MNEEVVNIVIKPEVDFSGMREEVAAAGKEIRAMKEDMTEMPNISRMLNSSLERTASIADSITGKIDALQKNGYEEDGTRSRRISDVEESKKDLDVLRSLQLGDSSYGIQMAKSWFRTLPQAVQKEFDAITPRISAIIRSRMSSFTKDGLHFEGSSIEELSRQIMSDKEIQKLIGNNVRHGDQNQFRDYLKHMLPNTIALNRLNSWHEARYGSAIPRGQDAIMSARPETLFPKSYVESYQSKGFKRANLTPEQAAMVMDRKHLSNLGRVFADNPIAVKAAIASGISRRDDRGILETREEISRAQWEDYREKLYNELENRASGVGKGRVDFYSQEDKDIKTLARRLSSSSSGTTMLAMHALEAMNDPSAWVASRGRTGYIKQQTEAKQMLDRYATTKYSPFTSGGWEKSQNVMIPESQNTDLFGRRNWKNNQDISDTIALVSLAGYNEKNPEHFNALRNLYANGKEINGVQMVAVGTHGNGNDTVVRMASKAEVDRIEKEEQEWARAHGFSGSYFGNYTDAERARRAALPVGDKERLTVTDLGKQFDAENKGWSPSANLGINLNGKRFALVDYGDEGDGSGWVSSSVLPHSIQGRFGVAGKGSLYTVYAKNNREFAEKNGLLDENGRWMATGINGEKFDIADYDGVIPTSMIKNMMAYRRADGSLPSPQEASAMLTAAMQRYGLRAISDYETENTNSNRLGTQMTSFMRFSPDLQQHQIEMAAKRMGELETEDGMLRYVFNNPENDYVANQVKYNRQLLSTPTARARVDAYKESLMRDIVSGQYIDFGESDSKISNIRAADNPLRAFFASNGGLTPNDEITSEFLARARTALQKAHGREYSDKEISDLINLGKDENGIERAIDFNHIKNDRIGILRSPTGYGNMVYARNVAAEAAPLFDEFGINKTGAFVSKAALETLQSADYDGDRFKVVTGDLAEAVKRTMDEVDAQRARIKGANTSIITTPVAYDNVDIADTSTQETLYGGRKMKETLLMGTGSSGGRAMQLDLSNPINNPYIIAEEKLQQIYDKGSVYGKKPENIDLRHEKQVWNTELLGKEWTRFSNNSSELFQFDPDQLDENNKPIKDKDVFEASNGRLVNMRRLRDMDIENINLPAVFMDAHAMGLGSARRIYQENRSETSSWDAIAEAMKQLDYHGGGEAAQRLMKTMRPLFPQFGSGARGQLEPEEEIAIRGMIADLRGELKAEADKSKIIGTGMWHSDKSNRDYYSEKAFIEGEGRRYGLHTAEQAVNLFGFTRDRISRRFGEQHANDLLANDPTISFVGEKAEQSAQEAAESSRKASKEAAKQQQEIAKAQEESNKAGKAIVEVSKMLPPEARSVKHLETAEQEAQRLLKESGLRRSQIDAFMGLPRDLAAEAITANNPEALLTKGIGEKTASRIIGVLAGSRYADFKITSPGPDRAFVTSEQVPSAESFVPKEPEQMMICDICGTEFPASLGKCPNEANHPNKLTRKQMRKREAMDQKQLAKVQAVESDASQTLEESYGKILSSFAGIESSKAIATKMIEGFGETIKGHNRILNANTDQTAAEKFYGIEGWKKRKAHQDFDWANQNLAKEVFGEGTELRKKAQASLDYIDSGYINATRQWSGDQSGKIVEGLRKSVTGVGDEFDRQEAQVKSYSEAIKELESNLKQFQESRNQLAKDAADNGQFLPKSMTDADQATLDKMKKDLEEAQALRDQGIANIKTKNNQSFMDRADTLYDRMYGKTSTPLQKVDRQVAGFQSDIAAEMARLETAKEKDKISEEDYLARKQRFEELQQYTDGNLRNDLYNRYFDQASKQTDRMIMQSDRMTRQRHMRASMTGVGRFMMQNEGEYQQREQMQNAMQTRLTELTDARSGMKEGSSEYARATEEINKLTAGMNDNKAAMDSLKGPAGALNATFSSLQMSVSRLMMRLGRQMFMKALNEAKKFVQEFDKSMTSIQMITLKSDEQMSTLGDGLISKAKELKISIAEITQSAETLYRQGLSDEEVNQRLDVISKFSKVSGTKVDAATKLITIAMNTGLVSDPQNAADIVTALGDNAATNASEIEKGIEKAGAAAAADGTTFAQLASMLTAITSTTQIGGNVAGRTLNTIFGRMNKIGTNELIYDENGNAISGSAVAKLLEAQGISQYDTNGNKRSSYDVLYDLSQKWDKMSDAGQQQIANAIAGTRQYSNFAAIMQGMSEGKVSEYMSLTGSSEGIVDEKYEIYVKSMQASLTDLKTTFDELVHDLTNTGTLTGIIDFITNMISGVDNLTDSIGSLGAALTTVLPMIIGLTLLKTGMSTANFGLIAGGVGAIALGGGLASIAGNQFNPDDKLNKNIEVYNKAYEEQNSELNKLHELHINENRTKEEDTEYLTLSKKLAVQFGLIDGSAVSAITSIEELTAAISQMGDTSTDVEEAIKNASEARNKAAWAQLFDEQAVLFGEGLNNDVQELNSENSKTNIPSNVLFTSEESKRHIGNLWHYDDSEKKFVLDENAVENQNEMVRLSKKNDALLGLFGFVGNANNTLFGDDGYTKSWDKDIKPYLPNLYYAAARGGYIKNEDGSPLSEKQKILDYWQERLSSKQVTEAEMQGMLDYYNSSANETGYSPKDRSVGQIKTKLKERLVDNLKLNQWMTDSQIDNLAELGAKHYMTLENPEENPLAISEYLFGTGFTQEERIGHANKLLSDSGYQETDKSSKPLSNYNLEEVNASGYYIDLNKNPGEAGYYVSKEEAEQRVKAYNESLKPVTETKTTQRNNIMFGEDVFASFDSGDAKAQEEATKKYFDAIEKIKTVQDYLKQVSEDPNSVFQSLSLENKEIFASTEIQNVFKELGINYTENIAHFLTTKAEDMFNIASEAIEKETTSTNPLETPNLQAVQDFALGGRTNSYNKWSQDAKTSYKLTADRVYRVMQASGATDIDTWLNYVNDNGVRDFETLYQNGEFGKLMQQVNKNPETGKYEGPTDIMDQIMRYTLSNGSEGAGFVSNKQKADYAQSMYDTLLSGETAFISYEVAQEAEKADRSKYEAWVKQQVDEARAKYGDQFTDADYSNFEKNVRLNNAYTGVTADTARIFTDDEKKYLQEIVGEELYDRLTGRSGVAATADEQAYAAQLISNKQAGLTSLTSRQQYDWLVNNKSRLSTLGQKGGMSRTVADAYLSQWSGWSEYAALLEKKNTSGLSPEEQQQFDDLTQSLENFEQQSKIKIDIEGVKQLEEAGKVAEGTAAAVEKLKKGGKVAIEVVVNAQSKSFSSGQTYAKLLNGSTTQQDEAIMALTGVDRETLYANRAQWEVLANLQASENRRQEIGQYNTWRAEAEDAQIRGWIDRAAMTSGYRWDNKQQTYVDTGAPDISDVNPLAGVVRAYTDAEKNKALDQILAGTLLRKGNEELYDAAIEAAGENTRELLRRQEENRQLKRDVNYGIEPALVLASQRERTAYNTGYYTQYGTRLDAGTKAQYAFNNYSPEKAADIATFLDMDETEVKRLMSTDEGKTEIQNRIKNIQKEIFSALGQNLDIKADFVADPEAYKAELKEKIETTEDTFLKSIYQWMLDSIDDAGNFIGNAGHKSFNEIVAEKQQEATNRQEAYSHIGTIVQNKNYSELTSEENGKGFADYGSVDPGLLYMIKDRADKGEASLFTDEMINTAYNNAVMSRESSPFTDMTMMKSLFGGNLTPENMVSTYQKWKENPQTYAAELSTYESLQGTEDLTEGMTSQADAVEKTTKALHEYTSELASRAIKYQKTFGDSTDDVVGRMQKAQKSTRGMAEAMKNFTSTSNKVADNQFLREQWKAGKKNKDVTEYITGLGFDKKDVYDKKMQSTIAARLKLEQEADAQDVQEAVAALTGDFQTKINEEVQANGPLLIDGVELEVGTPQIVSSDTLLNEFRNYMDPQLIAAVEYAKQLGFDLAWQFRLGTDGAVTATPVVNSRGAGGGLGGGRRSGSRSGGGGKSATDKLLESQDHRIKEAQHKVKMTQLNQEHYAFTNNYQSEIDSIYKEISAQKGLAEAYKENIEELKKHQSGLKKYSEDWWKTQEAINAAEEALKETQNTIEQLAQKQISVVQRKQENEDAQYAHKRSMIDSYVEKYQAQYQSGGRLSENAAYKKWVQQKENQAASIKQQIDQNKIQMAEWMALLATLDKDTQAYKDVQQKIWDIQKENAELENELLNQEIELNNARLERIAKNLQNKTGKSEHDIAISDTRAELYQIDRDYAGYRQELSKQKANYQSEEQYYTQAIEDAKKQMASVTKYSAAWYAARDALYEYQEALEKLGLTQAQIDQAIRESYLNEAFEKIEEVDTKNSQALTAAQLQTERAKITGDDKAYVKGLEKEEEALTKQVQSEKKNLDTLMELKNSGNIKKGTKEWDELLKKIEDVQNQIAKTENDVLAKANEVAAARLSNIMENYENNIRDTQHMLNMIQYQESKYKSSSELTNYGAALKAEVDQRRKLLREQGKTRRQLLKELNRYEVGSDQYNNVLVQIQKIEEEIAKTENAINSTEDAIKANEEAIRKVRTTLENTINNEIKKRIQQEKDQLSAEVSLQKSIFETIKKRYQDEWNLIKKDLDKKKQALQEEKSLIQERMNARKEAESQEDKYDELNELRKQLAVIEADPTRSKEAKELRKQIEDLQKELSGNLADNIAQAEQKRIDDIIHGISDYQSNREEELNELLKDSKNFKDVFDAVLGGSEEDFITFMRENDENWKNSTEEQRKVLEQGWHDTWLKMKGDVETYWDQVLQFTEITDENKDQLREDFINYMKQSQEYQNASVTQQASLIYNWEKMFDDYIASLKKDEDAGSPAATGADDTSTETEPPKSISLEDLTKFREDLEGMRFKQTADSRVIKMLGAIANALTDSNQYLGGGIVDYTGIARVDGTKSRPEAFLDAEDTANIRMMLDNLNYAVAPPVTQIDNRMFGNNSTVGDVHITINQAELNSDQDIDMLARKVGRAFTKELSKSGFNTASYAF